MCPADTSPEAWKVFLEIQRRLSPSEKLDRAIELSMLVRRTAEAGLRQSHPNADDQEIFLRLTRLALGAELFEKAYGHPVSDDGPATPRP